GYTTLEIKANLVRAITLKTGPIRATAKIVHMGKQTATAEGRIEDAAGKLYAHGTTTCMILSP
ncbi:MAG: hotdog fold thioesterase, partial [Terriglobales bacterium]